MSVSLSHFIGQTVPSVVAAIVLSGLPFFAHGADTATGGGAVVVLQAEVTERTVKGQLDACEVTYTVGFEDFIYRRGGVSALRGAVSLMGFMDTAKPPAVIFKAAVLDAEGGKTTLVPLSYVFIIANGTSFARKEFVHFTCEDGGACVGYSLMENPQLITALSGEGFQVGITRSNGASDVVIPVTPFPYGSAKQSQLSGCVSRLLEGIKRKFQ